jgi:hypothetical protein
MSMRVPSGSVTAKLPAVTARDGGQNLQQDLDGLGYAYEFDESLPFDVIASCVSAPSEGGILEAMLAAKGDAGLASVLECTEQVFGLLRRDKYPTPGVGPNQSAVLCIIIVGSGAARSAYGAKMDRALVKRNGGSLLCRNGRHCSGPDRDPVSFSATSRWRPHSLSDPLAEWTRQDTALCLGSFIMEKSSRGRSTSWIRAPIPRSCPQSCVSS